MENVKKKIKESPYPWQISHVSRKCHVFSSRFLAHFVPIRNGPDIKLKFLSTWRRRQVNGFLWVVGSNLTFRNNNKHLLTTAFPTTCREVEKCSPQHPHPGKAIAWILSCTYVRAPVCMSGRSSVMAIQRGRVL